VVLAVWLLLLLFANWWLARHAQGPFEQFWRFCTYGRQDRSALQAPQTQS
jgi:uncharacterized membrane protein YeiB